MYNVFKVNTKENENEMRKRYVATEQNVNVQERFLCHVINNNGDDDNDKFDCMYPRNESQAIN